MRHRYVDEYGVVHVDSLWRMNQDSDVDRVSAIMSCEMGETDFTFTRVEPTTDAPTCLSCIVESNEETDET